MEAAANTRYLSLGRGERQLAGGGLLVCKQISPRNPRSNNPSIASLGVAGRRFAGGGLVGTGLTA